MQKGFGNALREWRKRRRVSQLELALDAGVSARHVAFMETGRSKPSQAMVEQLIVALDVPHRDRNDLLLAAGFAPSYARTAIDHPRMAVLREGLADLMRKHDPSPALLLDWQWNLVDQNRAAGLLLKLVGGDELEINLLQRLAGSPVVSDVIENWPDVAAEFVARLRQEALRHADNGLMQRVEHFRQQVLGDSVGNNPEPSSDPLFNMRIRLKDGTRLSFYSVIGQFTSARDVTAAELRLELFFPADDATKQFLLSVP